MAMSPLLLMQAGEWRVGCAMIGKAVEMLEELADA
jgi:hypothetical protein